jgi:hypothetical protein
MTRALVLCAALLGPFPAAATTIESVLHQPMPASAFERIADYVGRENFDGRLALRSDPQERGGYYFIVRLDGALRAAADNTRVELSYFLADSPRQHVFHAPWPEGPKARHSARLYLGLTGGGDLPVPDEDAPLTAYRIRIIDTSTEEPLAVHKSFLWEAPEPPAKQPGDNDAS